jgi:hypothetical protein
MYNQCNCLPVQEAMPEGEQGEQPSDGRELVPRREEEEEGQGEGEEEASAAAGPRVRVSDVRRGWGCFYFGGA